ncbi:MAG: hypothetical protein IPP23_15095 [Sphingomonadales bacterium]|nr:hypothetical protein [Sphingomonadales bacterium]
MTRSLLWDAAPGEVRAGLVEDGALVEFRIFRPHRPLFIPGSLYGASYSIEMAARPLSKWAAISEAKSENTPNLPEGAMISVGNGPWSIPEPGRWKTQSSAGRQMSPGADFGL